MTDYVLVFVSGNDANPLTEDFLASLHLQSQNIHWLRPLMAVELVMLSPPSPDEFQNIKQACHARLYDVFMVPALHRRKKLLLADMDATIVEGETLDDLADQVGLKEQISAITTRAMRGELDFKEALEQRISMLQNLPVSALETSLSFMKINQGAKDLVRVMKQHGAECYLVSGGFTFFTGAIAKTCGFNGHHGNHLDIVDGRLTGKVTPPILDKESKLTLLCQYTSKLHLQKEETMAVGDGANDVPMLLGAGIGIGYYPKPLVYEKIQNVIVHTDLTSLLYIQGYTWQNIAN